MKISITLGLIKYNYPLLLPHRLLHFLRTSIYISYCRANSTHFLSCSLSKFCATCLKFWFFHYFIYWDKSNKTHADFRRSIFEELCNNSKFNHMHYKLKKKCTFSSASAGEFEMWLNSEKYVFQFDLRFALSLSRMCLLFILGWFCWERARICNIPKIHAA